MTDYRMRFLSGTDAQTLSTGSQGNGTGDTPFTAVSGSPTLDKASSFHGTDLGVKTTATAVQNAFRYDWATDINALLLVLYLQLDAVNTADEYSLRTHNAADGRLSAAYINTAQKIRIADAGSTNIFTFANALATLTRYRLELLTICSAATNTGTIKAAYYLGDDTTPVETAFTTTTANTGGVLNGIHRHWMGKWSGGNAIVERFGGLAWRDGATDIGWPFQTPAAATAYPINAVSGAWTINGSGVYTKPQALSDSSDTTYLLSPGSTTNEADTVRIGTLSNTGTITVHYRAQLPAGSTATQCRVTVLEGSTVRKQVVQTLTTSWADYTVALNSAESAAVTDRSQLRVMIEGNAA